jgi:5-methylcytosine-specific restriction endonuclease McrA
LNEFSEEFCDLRELFVSLPIHFEVAKGATSFSPNPELLLKIEAYIKDELTFHLTDKFKDLVEELKNYGVSIRDNSGGGYRRLNLTWEKYYHARIFPKIALKILDERLSKVIKEAKLQNLRSLAAKNTEDQRNVARAARSVHVYNQQTKVYAQCPYCFGVLGDFEGDMCCELDHIHPVSKGGLSTAQNLVFICSECNRKKSAQTLNQFIMSENLDRDALFLVLGKLGKDF